MHICITKCIFYNQHISIGDYKENYIRVDSFLDRLVFCRYPPTDWKKEFYNMHNNIKQKIVCVINFICPSSYIYIYETC